MKPLGEIQRRVSLHIGDDPGVATRDRDRRALKRDAKYGSDNDRTEGRIWWDVE